MSGPQFSSILNNNPNPNAIGSGNNRRLGNYGAIPQSNVHGIGGNNNPDAARPPVQQQMQNMPQGVQPNRFGGGADRAHYVDSVATNVAFSHEPVYAK
mmetsp:Transcript_13464/g.11960  ORF Transcript_13464/g.11960 Transcript_13464/m.11960 type:complete len:98 (+) Transcript_13464:23-316(+)